MWLVRRRLICTIWNREICPSDICVIYVHNEKIKIVPDTIDRLLDRRWLIHKGQLSYTEGEKVNEKMRYERESENTLYITRVEARTWRETIRECVTDVAYNVTIAKPRLLLRLALVFAHQLVRSLWYSRTLRLAVSFTLLRSPTMALNSSHHSEWSNTLGGDGHHW